MSLIGNGVEKSRIIFLGNGTNGKCPAGEEHDGSDSLNYYLPFTQ